MTLAPLIQRLAFLPAVELRETLSVFRETLSTLGPDLLLNQRLDSELDRLRGGRIADGSEVSPQLVTHIFEWRDQIDAFAASHATTDGDFAARLRRLTETANAAPLPLHAHRNRTRRLGASDASTVIRGIRDLFDAPPPESAWPETLWIGDSLVAPGDRTRLANGLRRLFGFRVSVDDFLNAFRVDAEGYRLGLLIAERDLELEGGRVLVTGNVHTEGGERAGVFQHVLFSRPPPGGEWRAGSTGYNPLGSFEPHTGKGLARGLHRRFFSFLYLMGLDRFYLSADRTGHFVWPHLGFRHREPADVDALKDAFRIHLEKGGWWSPKTESAWKGISESWDFCDFELAGVKVGRAFLLSLSGKISQDLWFPVGNLNDESWKRLFSDRSVRTFSPTISGLREGSPQGS